ncbi:MAG: hypothetical protein QFX35_04130 [Candidatus Verstraetearchaeota archaeon]|nr:hypothetical protein [Candidatus Verstraetearchaeota archaeon]
MILLISEAIILLLVVNGILTIASLQGRLEEETEAVDLLKSLEFSSYNALFDLCWFLKSNTDGTPELVDEEVLNLSCRWCETVCGWGCTTIQGVRMMARIDSISVEAYDGQSLDTYQMRYIGRDGNEQWFISGTLIVEFWKEGPLFSATYEIRIAV